ncbi:hypothetical protein DFH27DRAFT_390864 [Peziza echinospora]|nr:hypothetical protein DFH27DRAFT_390864 [Peziza echinospora]
MSTSESPAPKSRGRHRANNKSGPASTSFTLPHNAKTQQNVSSIASQTSSSNISHQVPRPMTQLPKTLVTPPQSPSKVQQSQSPANASASKKKRKSKPRPKDVTTDLYQNNFPGYESPALSSSNDESSGGQSSPTRGGVLNTPTKAYAGPNFHSSPAPSSLPIPSWFSKSVPGTPSAGSSLQALLEMNGEDKSLSQSLEEPESHLQKLFRADKEEKARQGRPNAGDRTQSTQASSTTTLSQNSPNSPIQPRRRNSPDIASSGLFAMDNISGGAKLPNYVEDNLFTTPTKPPVQQRNKAAALMSYLNQSTELPQDIPVEKTTSFLVTLPQARPQPQKRAQYSPGMSVPRVPMQTPTKKPITAAKGNTYTPERQPQFNLSSQKSKGNYAIHNGYPSTPSPQRSYPQAPAFRARDEIKRELQHDSVLPVAEMEVYLRRILKLEENRSIATPAAAS